MNVTAEADYVPWYAPPGGEAPPSSSLAMEGIGADAVIIAARIAAAAAIIAALIAAAAAIGGALIGAEKPAQPAPQVVVVIDGSRADQLRAAEAERDRLRRDVDALRAQVPSSAPATPAQADPKPRPRRDDRPRLQDPSRKPQAPEEDRKQDDGQEERPPEPPPAPAPETFDVAISLALENLKIKGSNRPYQALSETIRLYVAGRPLRLEVSADGRKAVGKLRLPAGTHDYTLAANGRVRWFPGGGEYPRSFSTSAEGSGRLVVNGDEKFVVKRGEADGTTYDVRLEPAG
jgi:hypothetical protein